MQDVAAILLRSDKPDTFWLGKLEVGSGRRSRRMYRFLEHQALSRRDEMNHDPVASVFQDLPVTKC